MNSYKGNFFDRSGKIGIECKSNIFGFVTYDTNTGNVKEGGICVIGSSTFSASYPFPPVPLTYLKLEVTGSFSMGLNLRVIDNKLFPYGELELIFDPRFGLEANALVANAYAGISGKINASLKFPSVPFENTFEANLTASVFFEYNAFIWGDKFEWEFKEWQLYPKKTKTNTAFSISRDDLKFIEPLPQVSAYSVSNEPNVFKNNMQIYCRPQIIDLDNGKMLMTYIDDSPNRSAENRTILMYSIFENDEWSVPKAVSDDKTADFEPSIYPDGNGGAHILWQNATKLFDNTVTLEEMSDNIDLQYIHFNGTSFDNSAAITTNNNDMEMMHRVVSNGDDISVVWVQNSENDTFGLTGKNSVFRKEYANGKWSDIKTVDSELQVISSIDTTYDGSKNIIAYTTKTGDDNSTADDLEVFYYNGNRVKQLTKDSFDELLEEVLDDCNYIFEPSQQLFNLILELRKQLDNCKGKKVYGYLPKKTKDIVNEILKELMKDENLSELYCKWNEINNEKLSLYYDNKNKTIPIEDNKEFRSIKNKIIQAVLNMDCKIPYAKWNYTDNGMILSSVVSLLADMFNTSARKRFTNLNNQIDKKQLSKEQEKRLAHGLKDLSSDSNYNDDYEDQQGFGILM